MITDSPDTFAREFTQLQPAAPACANGAFVVRPEAFSLATESARDNAYMATHAIDSTRAEVQHRQLARALEADVPITVFTADADTPDAMFPNNVFATTPEHLIVGRMFHGIRQREAANELIR